MKHKVTSDKIKTILDSIQKARPLNLTARLVGISEDTLRAWIKRGKEIAEGQQEQLFYLNEKEEELLGYLWQEWDKKVAEGQAKSYDKFMETGKKEHLQLGTLKGFIGKDPEKAEHFISVFLQDQENNNTPSQMIRTVLTSEERAKLQDRRGL